MTKAKLFAFISGILLLVVGTRSWLNYLESQRVLSISEVKRLCESRTSAKRVRFRGVVTLFNHGYLAVQGETSGIRLKTATAVDSSLVGHLLEITGNTPVGPGEEYVSDATYVDLGKTAMPQPRLLSPQNPQASLFDGALVTVGGVSCPGHFSGDDTVLFHLRTEGTVIQVNVSNNDLSNVRSKFSNAQVEFTGVAWASVDADNKVTSWTLWVPTIENAVVKSAHLDFHSLPTRRVGAISQVAEVSTGLPIRVRGMLEETEDRQQTVLTDASGSIPLHNVDGSGNLKASVDVVGYLRLEGSTWVLDDAIVQQPAGTDVTTPSAVLSTAQQVRALSVAEARTRRPVQLQGVITYVDPANKLTFLQDRSSGIYLWWIEAFSKLRQGDLIKVSGVSGPGDYAPVVMPDKVELISHNNSPPALNNPSEDEIFAGRADSQWVELEGTVRNINLEDGEPGLLVSHNGRSFSVEFAGLKTLDEKWINTRIRVHGVCASYFNSVRQLLGIRIQAQSAEQLTVIAPSPWSPYETPLTAIGRLLTFSPEASRSERLHLHGVVLASKPQGPTWIRDATGGVEIRGHRTISLRPGDDVDVAGFASAPSTGGAWIENAIIRKNAAGNPPKPLAISTDEVQSGARNGQLVQIDARVIDQVRTAEDLVLLVQNGSYTFLIRSLSSLPLVEKDSVARFTGICVPEPIQSGLPQSFAVLIRDGADVSMLRRAPWLTKDRAFQGVGALALLGFASAIWAGVLRRRVSQQTEIISQKLVEVEGLKQRAESGSRAKSEFLANISHEIRTPMNGILGMTELALEQNLEPAVRDSLRMVKASADSLLSIVNNILDLSKVEAGKLELDPIEFRLPDCIEETVCLLAVRAHAKNLDLICDLHPLLPEVVRSDESRIRQILTNLLSNAIKFTESGEVELTVIPEIVLEGRAQVRFTVRDTGIGIPPEKQSVIFSAFTQADTSTTRLYGGSGLGLSIASQLVNLLGGRIWVESEPGKGSIFHFTAMFDVLEEAGTAEWGAHYHSLDGVHVMLIESNVSTARALSAMFNNWKVGVTHAKSVNDALEEARRPGVRFDAIFCDKRLNQEEVDGVELFRRLAAAPALNAAKVILLGVRGKPSVRALRNDPRFGGYLAKPVRRRELFAALTDAIGEQRNGAAFEEQPMIQKSAINGHKLHVLVVEDNRINQIVAKRLIERLGAEVELAASGREAVRALEERQFDVVFMDIQMPEMDGLEVTREIRRRERGSARRQYIVAMTAHAMASDRERCIAAGMDDYLSKPVQPPQLKAILEGVETRAQSAAHS